jgi:hypothetical protein
MMTAVLEFYDDILDTGYGAFHVLLVNGLFSCELLSRCGLSFAFLSPLLLCPQTDTLDVQFPAGAGVEHGS